MRHCCRCTRSYRGRRRLWHRPRCHRQNCRSLNREMARRRSRPASWKRHRRLAYYGADRRGYSARSPESFQPKRIRRTEDGPDQNTLFAKERRRCSQRNRCSREGSGGKTAIRHALMRSVCVIRLIQSDFCTVRTPVCVKSVSIQRVASTMFEVADLVAAHQFDNAFPQPRGRFD